VPFILLIGLASSLATAGLKCNIKIFKTSGAAADILNYTPELKKERERERERRKGK